MEGSSLWLVTLAPSGYRCRDTQGVYSLLQGRPWGRLHCGDGAFSGDQSGASHLDAGTMTVGIKHACFYLRDSGAVVRSPASGTTGTKSNWLLSPPNPPSPSLPLASDGGFLGLRNVGL